MASLAWPLSALPVCREAGTFPMPVPGCEGAYLHPTIALHLHGYAGTVSIGRHRFRLEPGDLTFSPPKTVSRYELKESGTHLCLHFLPLSAASPTAHIRLPLHLRLGPQTAAARDRFWRIIDHFRQAGANPDSPARHAASAASAALQELLLWLALQSRPGSAARRSDRVGPALAKLRTVLDNSIARPSSLADLAAGTGLSSAYLARLFGQHYGMTVQHYLLQRRIELARHLLLASTLNIAEIGDRVGLPDPQYFNKQFRRVAGISPLAYRRENSAVASKSRK